jgi:hypothetical protein
VDGFEPLPSLQMQQRQRLTHCAADAGRRVYDELDKKLGSLGA